MARHLRKYIPGEPTIVVENMPGAGHLIGANYVYKVAKPDGLTIGHFIGTLFLQQLLAKPGVEFDALKFNFIGVPAQDNYMIGLSKTTGITSMEQWLASKRILKIGGIGAGSATDDIPKVLAATIRLPLQVVAGYKGTSEVRLAFNSGEIEGICNAWESFKSTWRKELDANEVALVLQAIPPSSGGSERAVGYRLCQDRRSEKDDSIGDSYDRPDGTALCPASRYTEGPR